MIWERFFLFVLAAGLPTGPAYAAQPVSDEAEEQRLVQDIKAQEDPTILKSRAWMEAEWNDDRHDASLLEVTLGARKGWRLSDRQDWGLQIEVPFRRADTGDRDGNAVTHGLADIKMAIGTAFHLSETWRIGGAVELRIPTGEEELSANVWRVQELLAVAWDATPWLTFSPKAEYNQSVARQHGAASQHFLELFFPATFILPDRWSVTPRYETKLDFENDVVTHSGKLSVGKQLEHPAIGLGLAFKMPLDRQNTDYQLTFSITDYF